MWKPDTPFVVDRREISNFVFRFDVVSDHAPTDASYDRLFAPNWNYLNG